MPRLSYLKALNTRSPTSGYSCSVAAEILATVPEQVPPARVTRTDGAVLPFSLELDHVVQPARGQFAGAINQTMNKD
jgi:pyruvate dehydrogenase E1 component beta subunit